MTRIRRGYIARRRRIKKRLFVSSFRGGLSKRTRSITQQERRALASSHRDRDRQKINFRRLWITRINSVIREGWVSYSYSYSRLIHDLYKSELLLNRKILAQIAIANKNCLYLISNESIKEVNWLEGICRSNLNGVPRRMNSGRVKMNKKSSQKKYESTQSIKTF
uniref:Large ribosomal subunit protein bL20c n=1 Tax=Cyphia tortilis TaxID=2041122 RepID=A0A291F578_9ASTR|nr:ribosomal protein L20 [Cyphia tortilis]ATG27287.1 ribosomal protein L20 [Cyphia tortilis]